MHKSLFSHLICLMAMVVLPLVSCSPDHLNGDGEYMAVSLSLSGEAVKDGMLITEKGGDDLYGVNVFYDKDGDGTIDTPYGYGLFDNPDLMKVELLKGYRYKFEYTIVRDGKNQLNNSYGGRAGRYGAPFYQEMENVFVLGNGIMKGLHLGQASLIGERFYKATTPLDRFYGEVSGYEPADGDVVQLPVLRTSFGARFVITNLNESRNAKFRGTCSDFWDEKTQTNGATYEYICSFPDLRACWAYQGIYSFYLTVMGAHSAFGTNSYSVKYTDVMFKRNKITTVYIQCDLGHGALFSTTEEDMEL